MKPGAGKAKGSQYERYICKALSLWITNGLRQDVFWRSSISGGRATVAHRKGQSVRQCGDICAVAEEGMSFCAQYYIECKAVRKLGLDQFLIKDSGPLANYWRIAQREADNHDRVPLLIAKQNGWPTIVVTKHNQLQWADPYILTPHADITLFDTWMEHGSLSDRSGRDAGGQHSPTTLPGPGTKRLERVLRRNV